VEFNKNQKTISQPSRTANNEVMAMEMGHPEDDDDALVENALPTATEITMESQSLIPRVHIRSGNTTRSLQINAGSTGQLDLQSFDAILFEELLVGSTKGRRELPALLVRRTTEARLQCFLTFAVQNRQSNSTRAMDTGSAETSGLLGRSESR
jgi:hypothetical protein